MKNYEAVQQWAAGVNMDKAYKEIIQLKQKYKWLPCEETLAFMMKLSDDLPKIIQIIKQQEKQNAIHREFVRVSKIADEAIVLGIKAKFNL
jgi:hypothetical protein